MKVEYFACSQVYSNEFLLSIQKAQCFISALLCLFRMQAQHSNSAAAYKGMSDVFWRTFQNEGFRGFYKGLFPNLLKVVPSASITYLVYEAMKKRLDL